METLVTDAAITAAIEGWNAWETAVNRAERWSTPARKQVNGRRWFAPGE